jgi:hypothetical protein
MKRILLIPLLLWCALAHAQSPGFVQACSNSLTWGFSSTNLTRYILNCNQPTKTGNVVIVALALESTATVPTGLTITDNASGGSNTYTRINTSTSATNGSLLAVFCGVQTNPASQFVPSGTTDIGSNFVWESATEFFNVTTGAGGCTSADQTWTGDGTTASTSVACGSAKAPTTSGDLLLQYAYTDNGGTFTGAPPFTPGSQTNITWHLIPGHAQNYDANIAQYGVYSSTATINPTMTWSASQEYLASCVALKAASSGSNATGPYIRAIEHMDVAGNIFQSGLGPNNNTSPIKLQFPTYAAGDTLVLVGSPNFQFTPTAISTTAGETWAQAVKDDDDVNAGSVFIWYACNAAQSDTRTLSVTMANSGGESPFFLYDISGLNTGTCLDTTGSATGTQATAGGSVTAFTTIAPSAANEMVISTVGMQAGPGVSSVTNWNSQAGNFFFTATSGFTQECSDGEHPPSPVDECNAHASIVTPNTSNISMVANPTDNSFAFGEWVGAYAVFKAAAATTVKRHRAWVTQ